MDCMHKKSGAGRAKDNPKVRNMVDWVNGGTTGRKESQKEEQVLGKRKGGLF